MVDTGEQLIFVIVLKISFLNKPIFEFFWYDAWLDFSIRLNASLSGKKFCYSFFRISEFEKHFCTKLMAYLKSEEKYYKID